MWKFNMVDSASNLTDSSGQLWQSKQKPIHVGYMCCTCWFGLFCGDTLNFLLVGYTHENIDQRFGVIFRTFERQYIDSMQQLWDLVMKGTSPTKTYNISRRLEYIRDWKNSSLRSCLQVQTYLWKFQTLSLHVLFLNYAWDSNAYGYQMPEWIAKMRFKTGVCQRGGGNWTRDESIWGIYEMERTMHLEVDVGWA